MGPRPEGAARDRVTYEPAGHVTILGPAGHASQAAQRAAPACAAQGLGQAPRALFRAAGNDAKDLAAARTLPPPSSPSLDPPPTGYKLRRRPRYLPRTFRPIDAATPTATRRNSSPPSSTGGPPPPRPHQPPGELPPAGSPAAPSFWTQAPPGCKAVPGPLPPSGAAAEPAAARGRRRALFFGPKSTPFLSRRSKQTTVAPNRSAIGRAKGPARRGAELACGAPATGPLDGPEAASRRRPAFRAVGDPPSKRATGRLGLHVRRRTEKRHVRTTPGFAASCRRQCPTAVSRRRSGERKRSRPRRRRCGVCRSTAGRERPAFESTPSQLRVISESSVTSASHAPTPTTRWRARERAFLPPTPTSNPLSSDLTLPALACPRPPAQRPTAGPREVKAASHEL